MLDTSTLQALWRGGALEPAAALFGRLSIPGLVAAETRRWWTPERAHLAPDVDALGWLQIHDVGEPWLRQVMEQLLRAALRRHAAEGPPASEPDVVVSDTRVVGTVRAADGQELRCALRLPAVHVLALALAQRAMVIVDDNRSAAACDDLGLQHCTTLDVIDRLARTGAIADKEAVISAIHRTGYRPNLKLRAVAW